ncbi:DUF1905 domain-containing protein [Phycicoccus sp. BSK3Z-2]|uniref:DUF1905 domain-containing protein n=1 Tax=Phycicoccus avicenniae TaxID=2828860 RepID=A0A941DAI3_9MICO|nr:DUF1905 domain-containing protein [Phycicoccus avicenniae]MBR7744123.1 DUF1905 domain-containing protein [Phycicoccus avicenniae]
MDLTFSGAVYEWRGPAPHHFVDLPEEESAAVQATSALTSYGWGCIPLAARIGRTDFTTALIPRGERYALPLKAAVRRAEGIGVGDTVEVALSVDV